MSKRRQVSSSGGQLAFSGTTHRLTGAWRTFADAPALHRHLWMLSVGLARRSSVRYGRVGRLFPNAGTPSPRMETQIHIRTSDPRMGPAGEPLGTLPTTDRSYTLTGCPEKFWACLPRQITQTEDAKPALVATVPTSESDLEISAFRFAASMIGSGMSEHS